MLNQRLVNAINQQIVTEFSSAYLYLAMAGHFENANLQGFAAWMRVQAQEEASHALIFFNFLTDRSGQPVLGQLEVPPAEFGTPQEVFKRVKDHERKVSESINALADLAVAEKDHATRALLDWFTTEQVEEQAVSGNIHARLKLVNGDPTGILVMDQELGQRKFVLPPPLAGKI
jgi:ferritin